jgi:hypothetical protein
MCTWHLGHRGDLIPVVGDKAQMKTKQFQIMLSSRTVIGMAELRMAGPGMLFG